MRINPGRGYLKPNQLDAWRKDPALVIQLMASPDSALRTRARLYWVQKEWVKARQVANPIARKLLLFGRIEPTLASVYDTANSLRLVDVAEVVHPQLLELYKRMGQPKRHVPEPVLDRPPEARRLQAVPVPTGDDITVNPGTHELTARTERQPDITENELAG